jgi:catalase
LLRWSKTGRLAGEPAFEVSGLAKRYFGTFPNNDSMQVGNLYCKAMTDQDLIGNIVDHLGGAQKRIRLRQTALFFKA